ncbi:MAG: M20/M25/M40 family metallo-hydrolase [Clostridia bacterium]|nr:M20/M25/M40 family metallo-hydrolase [Clostridia bacterium]
MNKITARFLELFYKISGIPRESGREEKFADFLESFAKEHNLYCFRDKNNNVLIKKQGNKQNNETVIFQAHMDMVCVKCENSKHNFETDPIEIVRNGDIISAKDTSLGADQGIGLAIMLLLLESDEIVHPNLECMFTTEEETTFNGAVNFDYSKLSGKKLINLDHYKDNTIVIGCSAEICNKYTFEGTLESNDLSTYEIYLTDIKGGNSRVEIERCEKNAITQIAKIIQMLQTQDEVYICSIDGGKSEGDIATSCRCIIKTKIDDIENRINCLNIDGKVQICKAENRLSFSLQDSKKIILEIISLNQGIIMKENNNILVSGNIGIIKTVGNKVYITGIMQSLDKEKLENYNKENIRISNNNNYISEEVYQDSAWIPNEKSKLLEDYRRAYYRINGSFPTTEVAYGGLECCTIAKRIKDMDMISIGSNIEGFHSVNEKMYISSCEKTIKTLLDYLKN